MGKTQTVKQRYPEHQKLKAVQEKSQAIGEFIEWARGFDVMFSPIGSTNIEEILAKYFNIDLNVIEKEKRAMLDEIRAANKKR